MLNGLMNVVDMVSKIFRTAASSFFIFDGFRSGWDACTSGCRS